MINKCLWIGVIIIFIFGFVLGILSVILVTVENIKWLYGMLMSPILLIISGVLAIIASNRQNKKYKK